MKLLPILGVFAACFAGVYGALWLHDRQAAPQGSGAPSLESLVQTKPIRYERSAGSADFSDVARRLMPTVVSIDRLQTSPFDPMVQAQVSGQGSGVIITSDGYIVTNNHVIEDAEQVVVHTMSGKQYSAKVVGRDNISDLALLKVSAAGLPAAELGDSDDIRIGEWVLAVGNPLGFEGTLSVGIVSQMNRDLPGGPQGAPLVGAIQTDAAINQGNSGGALANVHGQVIGINTQIASPNRGSVGIGFAIPANRVRKAVDDIRKFGKVRHPDLGVRRVAPSWTLQSPRFAEQIGSNPPERGLVVYEVKPGSPADKAGITQWDVIVAIDGKPVTSVSDYLTYMMKAEIGQKATVEYWHQGDGRKTTLALVEAGD
jgi:S1-C subfamily serine protease